MNTIDNDAIGGSIQIFKNSLSLSQGNDLLVIFDEDTVNLLSYFAQAAEYLSVSLVCVCVPRYQQARILSKQDISPILLQILQQARAIITCVNGEALYTRFRALILTEIAGPWTRIGHMPGADVQVLQAANFDIKKLSKICHEVELALTRGKRIEIISYDQAGNEYSLYADLGGWTRLSIASDSIIREGTWGNVPSGETYIAPIEGQSYGQIVINGSIPNSVLNPDGELLLTFEKGMLIDIKPKDSSSYQFLMNNEIKPAIDMGDPLWNNLAEIGIGLNKNIKRLTGNMLLDEKMAGTIHIAIGRNKDMNGLVMSAIHCDMVVTGPTVLVDDKSLLIRGELVLRDQDWQESYHNTQPVDQPKLIARSGVETDRRNNKLRRVCRSESGRSIKYPVGDSTTAKEALKLYCLLPENFQPVSMIELQRGLNRSSLDIRKLLRVLELYELVTIDY